MNEGSGLEPVQYPGVSEKPSTILKQLERDFETLDNISFETLAGTLMAGVPTGELKVDPEKATSLRLSEGLLTNYKSDQLVLKMDHNGHIWIGEAVEVGILQVELDHDSILAIAPEAKIGIIEVRADHDSLVIAGPNVALVKGSADHDFVLLHTPKTQVALAKIDRHGVETQTYGGNIYIPDARESALASQLLSLREEEEELAKAQEELSKTVTRRRRIITELQGQ